MTDRFRSFNRLGRVACAALLGTLVGSQDAAALQGPTSGAATAKTLTLPSKPGSVKGLSDEASVGVFSGQVSYAVPLDLPSGRAGFGPGLSLTYSGDLGNGALGIGWSLGQIAIRRTLRFGVPTYRDTDELELVGIGGGGRLYRDSSNQNRYWVEGHGKSVRVDKKGDYFEVLDGNGVLYVLGDESSSRLESNDNRRAAWFASRVVDVTRTQRINFEYERRGGQIYLKEITWGPGASPQFRLEVVMEARADVVTSWQTGFEVKTDRRISLLRVWVGGAILRSYRLTYQDEQPALSRFSLSRLAQVVMTGRQDTGPTAPTLSSPTLGFQYVPNTPAEVATLTGTEGWRLNDRGTSLADVDGDGMADLLRMELGNHQWRKNMGGTFDAPRILRGAEHIDARNARLMDVDGDARLDLVHVVDETWRVYSLVGQGNEFEWASKGIWAGTLGVPLHGRNLEFVDINGDRAMDVVRASVGNLNIQFGSRTGLKPVLRLPQASRSDAQVEPGGSGVDFIDANGDGLSDVVWMTDAWMKVWLGRGDGTFVARDRFDYPWPDKILDPSDVSLADLDRDGLLDLVRFTVGNVVWFPGEADGRFDENRGRFLRRPSGASADAVVTIADVNGNGSQELVWSESTGFWALDFAGLGTAGMLSAIDNGLGKTTKFTYLSSATLSVAAERGGQPWQIKLPASIPVPVAREVDLGNGMQRRVEYNVRDGFWDAEENRFGGFLVAIKTVPGATKIDQFVETTHFHAGQGELRVLRGVAVFSETRTGRDQLFVKTSNDWIAKPIDALGTSVYARVAVVVRTVAEHHEGRTEPILTRSTFDTDSEGRVVAEHHEGRVGAPGDEKEVRRSFADNESLWIRGRKCEEALFEGDGTTVRSRTRAYYTDSSNGELTVFSGNTNGVAGCGGVGFGWVKRTEAFLSGAAGGDRFVDVGHQSYDAYGNSTQIYDAGVTRTLGYDTQQFRPKSESVTPIANGASLTWTMEWDEVLGQPLEMTDANAVTTKVSYDALGRVTGVGVKGRPSHILYQYDWTAPRPRTATTMWDGTLASVPGTPALGAVGDPPPPGWRKTVSISNGAGEELHSATYLGSANAPEGTSWRAPYEVGARTWIITGWKERDQRGRVTRVANPFYSPTVESSLPDFFASFQRLEYDALDRLTRQLLPNGGEKRLSYRAFEQTVTSSELAPVTSQMDGFSRIIATIRQIPEGIAAVNVPAGVGEAEGVTARYDAADRILEMSLQGGVAIHSFVYDTLGRLVSANDPDVGPRSMTYTDWGWLKTHTNGAQQTIEFDYDNAGRLTAKRDLSRSPVQAYAYHYDEPMPVSTLGPLGGLSSLRSGYAAARHKGRLSWVSEPQGVASMGYDEIGQFVSSERRLYPGAAPESDSPWALEERTLSASGLLLEQYFRSDNFKLEPVYDRAGRLLRLGNNGAARWSVASSGSVATADSANALDASGSIMAESYGNGVAQSYARDVLGLASSISVDRPGANGRETLFATTVTRNLYGAPATITDTDARFGSLDHSASYGYDAAARLISATQGAEPAGPVGFIFRYQYDGLQNMVARAAKFPSNFGVPFESGVFKHGGERPGGGLYGPRQMTGILRPESAVLCPDPTNVNRSEFQYDGAGRLNNYRGRPWSYDGYDQLRQSDGVVPTQDVLYHYGYDGFRSIKVTSDNSTFGDGISYWFSPNHVVRNGEAEHSLTVGDRLVARVGSGWGNLGTYTGMLRGPGDLFWGMIPVDAAALMLTLALMALALGAGIVESRRRRRWQPGIASLAILSIVSGGLLSCTGDVQRNSQAWQTLPVTYIHQGVSAGPVLFTDEVAHVREERRYEPFGVQLDSTGEDLNTIRRSDPQNILNKETDRSTGWSYHGARWMSPDIARWLSPDPPVKAPDGKFMGEPWAMNPYGYVQGNPTVYWDPDGNNPIVAMGANASLTTAGGGHRFDVDAAARDFRNFGEGYGYGANRIQGSEWFVKGVRERVHNGQGTFGFALGFGLGRAAAQSNSSFYTPNMGMIRRPSDQSRVSPRGPAPPTSASAPPAPTTAPRPLQTPAVTRVGRWMSEKETQSMLDTQLVQAPENGATALHVTVPPNPNAFKPPARSTKFVEFDVPDSQLRIHDMGNGWGRVFGPGSLEAKVAEAKGLPTPTAMPPATNIDIRVGKP
jgi:RHS repeat-associated protein